jgi:hypothetical protein
MGFLFDQAEKNERLGKAKAQSEMIDMFMEVIIARDPEAAARMNLIKTTKKVTDTIIDKIVSHDFTDKCSDKQLDEVRAYLEMVIAGFNTFMEQFESTVEKENPHTSGN